MSRSISGRIYPGRFSEILRALKPGGRLLVACESGDASDTTWTSRLDGMAIYTGEDLKARLEAAGFVSVKLEKARKAWFCVVAEKPV